MTDWQRKYELEADEAERRAAVMIARQKEIDRLRKALAELLRLAEREHGGGSSRPEEWYAARDEARLLAAGPEEESDRGWPGSERLT